MADDFGYHIDHHGSLVRPASLLAARASGLSGDALTAATDEAVVTLAHELRRLTLNAMSDGQFRVGLRFGETDAPTSSLIAAILKTPV